MKRTSQLIAILFAVVTARLVEVDLSEDQALDFNEWGVLSLRENDLIKVTLRENPSTGYSWKYQDPLERIAGVFTVQMDEYTEDPNPNGQFGNSGIRIIVLKTQKAGNDDFELILVRSWEV